MVDIFWQIMSQLIELVVPLIAIYVLFYFSHYHLLLNNILPIKSNKT